MLDFDAFYAAAPVLYGAYLVAELGAPPRVRSSLLAGGLLVHLAGIVLRALPIAFFPLTNKFESFYAFAFAAFAVTLLSARSPSRLHRLGTAAFGVAAYAATLAFERGVSYPPPLMKTVFYPLHVPASFFAYALWLSAAADGLGVLLRGPDEGSDAAAHGPLEQHAFWGWCLFSLSMIFGGAWGYLAWGAYFLWDPKVVWSVILWLYYSGFVHLRYWPGGNRPRTKAALALVGAAIVFVAYVGTSFLFARSSHSFR